MIGNSGPPAPRAGAGRAAGVSAAASVAIAACPSPSAVGTGAGRGLLRMTAATSTMPARAEQAMETKISASESVRKSPDSRKIVATITRRKLTRSTSTPP